ncbi:MAG: NAD-glutamate dehydrogenase [Candidatus Palauibacterales bacterium]|nr:NAD-glutamate dehydrogenase [Candidatus Palauibacterales bacterium]MDP2529517.1 NAD-glutamate dehydrogenase [Candidatus Palauibacterales bacterium]MDP2584143.1 NAD-glutamate dehydrogenase [Candidatus Palauibacterales bacterium]
MEQTASTKQWIDRVIDLLAGERPDASGDALESFGRRLLARASADLLERRDPEALAADLASLFDFVQERGLGEIGVRVRPVPDRSHRTVVETVMPDRPFIVNTLREYLHGEDLAITHLLHPVVAIERDEEGRIVSVRGRDAGGPHTSVVYLEVEGRVEPRVARKLEDDLRYRLRQVQLATDDFGAMMQRCREISADLEEEKERVPWRAAELSEVQELLAWLEDGYFVFLGYRAYDLGSRNDTRWISVEAGTGLGILREESTSRYAEPRRVEDLPADLRARVLGGPLLIVSKTNAESPVHRRARMDYIGIKKLGPEGEAVGERRFLGLFTAKAYAEDASNIPILRRKLKEILEAEGASRGSHDYNQIVQIFNSIPKEELFLASVPELLGVIGEVMATEGSDEIRVLARPDPLARGVNVLVMLPRERFSEEVRRQVREDLLQAYGGEVLDYHLAMNGGDQARLHFYLSTELEEIASVDVLALEDRIRRSVRSWDERLSDALERTHDVDAAHALADRHQEDFSAEYKATIDVETAVEDIGRLENLAATGLQQLSLEPAEGGREGAWTLKVFSPRGMYVLSDLMPILENLGFRVIGADKYDLGQAGGVGRTIHTFQVETPAGWEIEMRDAADRVVEVFRAVRQRRAEDDRLNSLVLSAGLDWRQVALLRAYAGYAFRIGAVSSRAGVRRALTGHPDAARLLFEMFQARHDPGRTEEPGPAVAELRERFRDALETIEGIEEDRTFRRLLNLVQATVRTNFFQTSSHAREEGTIALKFDGRRIEVLPSPRPRYEIYVNSGHTEGAHLRMDTVARGGIRWSDRSEDFRVEVLGLVKTQQVKNAVIVPAGAKGAYVVKRAPEGRAALREAGVASYREFIGSLLDLTDNIVDGEVVHPPDTVIRDGEDPYLVVAADKGTADLSDTANELASACGFWLGDAFASGGSHGYDHKELGITARGAWASVKRHFREMGVDIQEEPFTVVGIGDMSGDVFGNGMLLSRRIGLVAAFDHRHIFLDPDPDPDTSFEERRRMFALPSSSWADYDPARISEGGGVFERGAKRIPLSSAARDVLDLEDEEVNGETLIRAILRADVDLLWNGGIGTYVKASDETHGQVGDPGNDGVRVDADELRARVVGEGGNLGFTQRGRIEYALRGGRINTDALDNSAGVDMSDHEVNLKILLAPAVEAGLLDPEARNALLVEVTDDVVEDVLEHNERQSLAISLDEHRVREAPAEFGDALVTLEREGLLDRALESLPTTEALIERQEADRHLTRPELCVLLAYAKLHLKRRLQNTDLAGDPALSELLRDYFPAHAAEIAGPDRFERHRLAPRIIATGLTNLFVDLMGSTRHLELVRETGRPAEEVALNWYAAYRIGRADRLRQGLEAIEARVPAGVYGRWQLRLSDALGRATRWLLANTDPAWSITQRVDAYGARVDELREALPRLLTGSGLQEFESQQRLHATDGLPDDVAEELAGFDHLEALLPVAELAREHDLDAVLVGEIFFGIAEDVDFPWLQARLGSSAGRDLWEQRASKTLALQLETARMRIAARLLGQLDGLDSSSVEKVLTRFRETHAPELARIRNVLADVRSVAEPNLAALMVAVHAIGSRSLARDDA